MEMSHLHRSLLVLLLAASLPGAAQTHRPPAVPLAANDPFFSLWSMSDKLTDSPTKHWSEAPQPIIGLARIDGQAFRWMGQVPQRWHMNLPRVEAMKQEAVEVTALHTRYRFSAAGIELRVTFFTPSFPSDLDVLSRPVTYLSWSAVSTDGRSHDVSLLLDVDPAIAVNDLSEQVTWSRMHAKGLTFLNVGSRDQAYLNRSGDRVRINWGYFHVAVPDRAKAATLLNLDAASAFIASGTLPDDDELSMPRPADARGRAAHLAIMLPLGNVDKSAVEGHVLLAYTQTYAIEYLGRRLRGYWQRHGMSETELLVKSEEEFGSLEARGREFDEKFTADMRRAGGDDYAYLASLLFRQTLAAHILVVDMDGTPLFFSKENDSNGCIDTVDVTYPSSPFFLLFNPELLKAQLEPLMRYAALPRWRFPFAPHDLGTYPLANGQVYGGGELTEENQMPVEESGNLLLMVAALGRAEGDWSFARKYMPQLTQWAGFLASKGMDPENQLSTDDFAGHLAHNANLSIKAIEALGAFVQIASGVGDERLAAEYKTRVAKMPAQWESMALEGDHYKLAFDQPGTWSQKYNLVWDDILGLHLFPKKVRDTEWAFYATHMQANGLPLDSRKSITKLDWEVWTATVTDDPAKFNDLLHRLVIWADSTSSRVPTTDYYDTVSGRQMGFQARSVVGGIFIKALLDADIAKNWHAMLPVH
jgi:hypothetical protein